MRVKSASLVEAPVEALVETLAETFARSWSALSTAMRIGIAGLVLAGCATRPVNAPVPSAATHAGSAESPDGTRGAAPTDAAAAMVESATAMLGQPYRFGGAAPGGFDCSGLVSFAAQSAGLHVPRTAREQQLAGMRITRREIEPGDLVFMRLAHKELHVGIAIGGERFIHAPSRGGHVRIDSLARAPYAEGFVDARRVVGAGG